MKNPNIEALKGIRVGDIVSFNGKPEKYKLVEVKDTDEFVFEAISENEANRELNLLSKVNQALRARWRN
jgi:hypothetical protein